MCVHLFGTLCTVKSCPVARHRDAQGENRYIFCLFLTSVPDGGLWSASRIGHGLYPGKDPRYQLGRRLGTPQSESGRRGRRKKSSVPVRDRTPVFQLVVRRS